MSTTKLKKPLEIKISTIPAVSVILRENELNVVKAQMHEATANAEDYFDNDLAIIDLAELNGEDMAFDWPGLLEMLRSHRLHPIAVRGASSEMEAEVRMHGLILDHIKPRSPRISGKDAVATPKELPPAPSKAINKSMIIDTPVRTGQRIYARDADLIVTAAVNSGAEIIADGSIHVYAPLRGRALAGATGDASARIFTLGMEAELVSIAGIYNTFENGFPESSIGRPVQIRLMDDRIVVMPVNSDARY